MATAACHLAKADRFLRRARDPTAGNPPAASVAPRPPSPHPVHKPLQHPGRHCAAARFRGLRRPAPAPIPDASLLRHPGRRNPESGRFRRRCLPRTNPPPPGLRNASALYIPRHVSLLGRVVIFTVIPAQAGIYACRLHYRSWRKPE